MNMTGLQTTAKIITVVGLTCIVLSFAAIITYSSAASVAAISPEQEALNYVHGQHVKKIIVDVDAGVDDVMALMLVLNKHQPGYPEVIAITCTHGNTNLSNVVINVLKTLRILKLKIPVYSGAANSLLTTPSGDSFYGHDGLGDVYDPSPPSVAEAEREHAAVALARLARQHAGELGVIALGPLTNLALAQSLDPNFKRNVRQLWWMGSSVEGVGNIKPGIEFNAFMDPEANYIVFNSTGPPVIILSWETCINHGSVPKKWRLDVLGSIDSSPIRFLNAIEEISLQKSQRWSPCDAKTMAVLIDPGIATKAMRHNVNPIFQGDARGAILVDYKDGTKETKNAVIVTEIDVHKFETLCINNLSGTRYPNKTAD